jgi:hypothetical protein
MNKHAVKNTLLSIQPNQQNPLEAGGVNHIHTIYRDPTNEHGAGLS